MIAPTTAFLTLFILSGSNAQDNPYCSISSCDTPSSNTLCQLTNTTIGAACAPFDPSASVVSADDIQTILSVHNNFRRNVAQGNEQRGNPGPQPPAANMQALVWDDELANMAQTHAQQCVFGHDECRDVSRFSVGQNIYIDMADGDPSTTTDWTSAITSWYDEVEYMEPAFVLASPAEDPPNEIGHYTQLVWATSTNVGCGIAFYQDTVNYPSYPNKILYACNYGPAGNMNGAPIYTQGPPGSACPARTTNDNGLCV